MGYTHARTVVLGTLTGTLFFNDDQARRLPLFGEMTTNNPSNHRWESGRLWVSRPMIGPDPTPPRRNWEEPGPLAYGAPEDDTTMIYVLNGSYLVSISPWQRIDNPRLAHLEAQRNRWLYERGYVGSVRTFVNDAYADQWMARMNGEGERAERRLPDASDDAFTDAQSQPVVPASQIQPRGVIGIPPDMPRFRKRMEVRHGTGCGIGGVPVLVQGHEQPRGVQTITGRGNSWTLIKVLKPTQAVADAQTTDTAETPASGV